MNVPTLIATLDNTLTRSIVSYKDCGDIIAYDCPNTTVTVNDTDYTPRRLFLIPKTEVKLGLYINNTVTEISISDITILTLQ